MLLGSLGPKARLGRTDRQPRTTDHGPRTTTGVSQKRSESLGPKREHIQSVGEVTTRAQERNRETTEANTRFLSDGHDAR